MHRSLLDSIGSFSVVIAALRPSSKMLDGLGFYQPRVGCSKMKLTEFFRWSTSRPG